MSKGSEQNSNRSKDTYVQQVSVSRRTFLKLMGAGALGASAASLLTGKPNITLNTLTGRLTADNGMCDPSGLGTGQQSGITGGGTGFSWDQTFTDTSWVEEAGDDLNVEVVTTLDFEASGGLREAVDNAADEPTVVVFEVGGVIEVPGHNFRTRGIDEVWIAGETAPWPGISITQCRTRIHGDRTILSHLSFMKGDQGVNEYDSSLDIDADDVMVDHCSAVFATEENIGLPTEVHRASVINTIIAEGLFDNIWHPDERARGLLVNNENCTELATMGCLFAHNNRRMPLTRSDMILVNNYIYNYAHRPGTSSGNIINFNSPGHPDVTAKGILFEPGVDTPDDYDRPIFSYSAELYAEDIEHPERHPLTDGSQDMHDSPPILPQGLDLENDVVPASEVKEHVLYMVGPRPADRPPYEQDLINERLQEPHGLIDSQDDVGGYPDYEPTSHSLDIPQTGVLDWLQQHRQQVEEG